MTIVVIHFLIGSFLLVEVASQPLKNDISQEQLSSHLESTAVAIFFFISVVITISYCVCCSAKNVKDLGQQNGISASHHSSNNFPSNVNSSEFTIFPPSSSIIAQPINYSDDKVTFEPLPEILPQKSHDHHPGDQLLLAKFNNSIHKGLSDWFNESLCDYFPRNKLQYHQELGSCWFGQVVLGEAKGIIDKEQATKVVVKILKQDATPNEYVNFLQEIRPFRDLSHPNVIKLLGYCLETNPYLFIMEHCAIDLKAYLISHCDEAEFLLQNGHILHMTCDIAAGLQHMHDHDFVHMDLAARNCFITADNIVKLGGYGTSLQIYKDEYYCQGNAALPLRWCDPDSITCVMNLIETREVTKAANVWSFGVILWEVLEFGKLPYFEHTDEEVLQKVILERSCLLKAPSTPCVHNDRIYEIMQMCWNPVDTRCSIHRIAALINHLYDNKDLISNSTAFETRWASLQPHSIEQNLFAPTESSIPRVVLKLENDFAQNSQMILQLDHSYISTGNTSPSHDSISNSTGIEFASVSPSMQNLRGSLEDLNPFGLSTDSISSEHIPSNNTFFCNVEHAKSNEMASKDIVSHSLSTPVSVNDIVLCHEQNIVMNDCKTGSSDITSVVVDNQCKGVLDKLEMSEQTENLSFVSERDNITFNEKCKNNEVMQGSQPALRTTEVDKRDTKSCFDNSCDMCTFKALRSNEGYKCMCSFDKSVKAPSNFINISQAASSDKSLFLEPDTTEIKNYIESTRRNFKPTNTYTSSSMQLLPTNSENVGFVNSKSCTSSSEDEKFITEQFKDKELMCANSMTYKCCETDCSDKVNNEKSEVTLDTALLNDLSTSCDGCTSSPRATKPSDNNTMINNDGTFFSNHNKFSNDEFIKSCSVHRESFNPEIENTAIDHLNASYSESPSHDNIVIYNQITDYFPMPTKKNISYPNKQVCPSNTNLEREIEPGGNKDKIFATVLSKNISSPSENFMTNTVRQQIYNPKLQILTNITKTDLENNADVESTNATPPLTITNCGKESLEMSDLNTKLTHYDIEKSCHNSILSNIKQSNEEQSGLSVEHQHDSQVDHTTDERSGLYDVSMCQSTQPIIQVTECSASPGSQSEGDEYQLEDISSVLKEVEQINIHDCATVSSAVEHNSVLLNDDRKLSGSHYSSDQAGPSEWKSDHTLATCSNYWTERIPLSSNSCSTIEEENNKMKSLSDVILEDLDADCEKDVVACYEPYQDPFETDEVLSIDTETNVAVLLDSHHSVIGFVPSKVDIFTGSREVEDEVLSNSEMQSNLSDFVDNNTQIYINGYKSSDSVSPRSLCSTSTDFSINADQQSETSVDSDLVPDLSASCSINECKASFENNSKSLLQQDLETKSEQQYASDTNLDFSVSNKVVKDMDLGTNVDFDMNCRQANSAMLNSSFLHHAGDIVSPNRDTYTPDFDSDTDDTSSTGTTCTSTSGSFECLYKSSRVIPSESMDVSDDENQSKSPVQIFSVTWDRNATPTKSSIKSPEKKGGQMKKSVSFQDEDPPLFSYPPESEGSDDDSRGFDYPANFLWNVDYSVYADWDFQSSLDLEEIPEDIVEVEDPEDDDEYLSFRYKSLPLRPIQVYTFTDITDDDYSESASLNTSLSDVGIGEQSADSQGMYLEAKSINDAPSPSSSVPKEVCQEVLEMYPNFDDLAMLDAVQNESDENSYHRSDNFTVVDVQDFDQVMDHSNFKKCYLNFAKHDTTLSSEHCEVSEEALAESENPRFFNDSLQKLHCGEPDKLEPSCLINAKKPRQATNKDEEDNGLVNNVCEVDSENIPEFFHEVKNLDEMCENSSYGNSVNFYQEDCYFKEINDSTTGVKYSSDVENKNNIEHSKSAVNAHLSHTDAKEKNNDKYAYTVDAEFLGAQSNKAECQSQDILDMQISELKNTSGTDQYSDSFSPADVSVNIDNTFQNYDKSKFLNAVNTEELGFDNCDLINNKAVIPSEYENSTGNIIWPNTLPLCTTDLKFPFQKNHESNFDEPQTTLSSTYIADDHSCDMLYLSKGSEKFPFVDKLDNSNIANDDNTNTSYYSSNLDEIDIAATNAGLQDGRNILYEDVAEGKDTSECSLSSKSTEDSSEKDSAISSGGEFSPAYSPGILQESRDTIWDFQHMSCVDDSEKSTLMENAKDDNENSNAGPVVNTDTSELLPAIVVSDSNNVNFTIHNASVMQTCNNFRYEHNGNIPTDTRGNVATSGCDKNDNIV